MVTFKCQRVALGPEQALSRLCGYKQMAQPLSLQGKISLHRWSTVIFSNINNKMLETALQPVKIPCPKDGNRRGCFWGISVAGYIRKEKKTHQDIPVMSTACEIKEDSFWTEWYYFILSILLAVKPRPFALSLSVVCSVLLKHLGFN